MRKSIDTVTKTRLQPITLRFYPENADALSIWAREQSAIRGFTVSRETVAQEQLLKNKDFRRIAQALKEAHDTDESNTSGA